MTKAGLIAQVAKKAGLTAKAAKDAVNTVFASMTDSLKRGEKVEDLPMHELLKDRVLLERFGFDADLTQWIYERKRPKNME